MLLGCGAVYGGGVREGTMLLAWLSPHFQSLSPTTHKWIGPFWCWFLGGWICERSRTPWVPPADSPVRLGVSHATTTPTGVYSCMSSMPHLPISAPPTSLDECFFFNPLVVRLPYSLIFWLLLVFKLFVVLFWLCKKVKCIYLCLHLGWKLSPWIKYADCHEQRLLSHHIDLRYIESESKCILNISPLLTE